MTESEIGKIIGRFIAPVIGMLIVVIIIPYCKKVKISYFKNKQGNKLNKILNYLLGWYGFAICCLLTLLGEELWGMFFYFWIFAWMYIIIYNFCSKSR
ncbi:hypothetical protein [Candidatus Deianiraea vastatrix]|uniref:Uncharacterized protein n=1 Tax=Candidatus Deianiraea vastatrix TaxID=2163644 RepID=A0A5B8XF27_9RICK|nr:hypothetical protein [Candidatus Deianiraea vastatrix]QED22951.1 hypothetical protein Deia_00140 [Candidatus Deianiraea vastatrix]